MSPLPLELKIARVLKYCTSLHRALRRHRAFIIVRSPETSLGYELGWR